MNESINESSTRQPALIFPTSYPNATFLGVHTQGGYNPQIRTRSRFLYNAPTVQVSSSYVYSFGSYRVDNHINRRRWKHPMLFATLRRWVISQSDMTSSTQNIT